MSLFKCQLKELYIDFCVSFIAAEGYKHAGLGLFRTFESSKLMAFVVAEKISCVCNDVAKWVSLLFLFVIKSIFNESSHRTSCEECF